MSDSAHPPLYSPQILRFWRFGSALLWAGLAFGILFILYLAWNYQEYVGVFVVLPVALAGGLFIIKRPELFLYLALAGFVIITDHQAGIQPLEALYGLLFIGFLGYWYFVQFFLKEEGIIKSSTDKALVLFLLYVALSTSWAILFGAKMSVIIGEALILLMIGFYFPVADLIRRNPEKTKRILLVICWFGLFVSLRNIQEYRTEVTTAEKLYQVLSGRVALNEVMLMMPSLGALTFLLYAETWKQRFILAGLFLLFFASLIVTQSRGYWMAFFLGALALFWFTDLRRKANIMLLFLCGVIGFISIGYLLFPQYAPLVIAGMAERLGSLTTAITSDISLVNRFFESMAVWEYIKANPVLGYGIGTPYEYFNIISDHTRRWAFIHNGYLGMWYKYGIIGLGLLLYFWLRSIWSGIQIFRTASIPRFYRVTALACTVCLIGEMLVANTSTPFQSEDPTLMITLLAAILSGLYTALIATKKADAGLSSSPSSAISS